MLQVWVGSISADQDLRSPTANEKQWQIKGMALKGSLRHGRTKGKWESRKRLTERAIIISNSLSEHTIRKEGYEAESHF